MDFDRQYRELAEAIAAQATAIAAGTFTGPRWAMVRKLAANVGLLMAWTPDDREATGSEGS